MSSSRLEKLLRLQNRENSKPRVSQRSQQRSQSELGYRTGESRPATGRLPPPSRPATGMSFRDQNEKEINTWSAPVIDEEAEEDYAEYPDGLLPPPTAGTNRSLAPEDQVTDEWALLNELDITSYQLEQERRRREEVEHKNKVKLDLMNQMREKSQSQQLARAAAEKEWAEQKARLDDWNEQERKRSEKRVRRMERRRMALMKQMEAAQRRKKNEKQMEMDEGRRIAAQIREDMHEEKERAREERNQAQEEFRLQCEENDLLQKLKRKQEEADANKAVADLDRYFTKKEDEENQRQKEIADRYNTCRMREQAHAKKCQIIDSQTTYHQKTDAELDAEMKQATSKFDEKESEARMEREMRKKAALAQLDRQIEEKEHKRRLEFNELLQTVGDMRDALEEHEEEERHRRIQGHLDKKKYGKTLQKQFQQDKIMKLQFDRGMSGPERRINLPLLERLRDAAAPALESRPNTGSIAPFSERAGTKTPGAAHACAGQHAKAKQIVKKMRGTSLKFG